MATATLEASFGGVPLVDPQELRDKTTPENLPQPWLGKANAYHCPIGPDAGEAWLLIRRKWLKTLDLNQRQTFTLQYRPTLQGSVNILNVQQMRVQSAVCVTPGQSEDDNGVYLLRATDQRWELSRYVTSRRFYNVRNSATPDDFYAWSEKSSAPWQWAEVFNDLWTNGGTGQGSSVGDEMIQWNLASFPFSGIQSDAPLPAAPPENVSIEFEPLLKSMQSIADLAGLWIRYDPHTHTLQLIAAGEFDDSVELAITSLENRLVWRDEMFDPLAQRLPFAIRVIYPVFFKSGRSEELSQRFQFAADGLKITDAGVSSSFAGDYSTAVDSIDPSVLDQSSIVTVYDSMAYLMDGASRNDAHYNSLIKQRTKDRYNQVLQYLTQVTSPGKGRTGRRLVYSGIWTDFRPCGTVEAVRWGDTGEGPFTEVIRGPSRKLPAILPPRFVGATSECPGQNQIEYLTISGKPTGGSYSLLILGFTLTFQFDDGASDIEDAITSAYQTAHPGADRPIKVTGGPGPNGTFSFEYVNDEGEKSQTPIVPSWDNLTGGAGVSIIVIVTAKGRSA